MYLLATLLTFLILTTSSGLNWLEQTPLIDTTSNLLNTPATSLTDVPRHVNKYAVAASIAAALGHPVGDAISATSTPPIKPPACTSAPATSTLKPAVIRQGALLIPSAPTPIPPRATPRPDTVSPFTLATLLANFQRDIVARITSAQSSPPFPQQIAGAGNNSYSSGGYIAGASQNITNLSNVTLNNPTIIGGTLSGTAGASASIPADSTTTSTFSTTGHFATGIIDALLSTAATISNLAATAISGNTLVYVSATTTNATSTNAFTQNLVATNATTTNLTTQSLTLGSGSGLLQSSNGAVSTLATGSNGQVLKIVGGILAWGTDLTGGSGGSSAWATTSNSLAVYTTDPTQVVLVGSNATSTTGNIFEANGNSLLRGSLTAYKTITAPSFAATSSTASQFPYASTTAITATTASTTNLWISSLASGSLLKVTTGGQVTAALAGTDYLATTTGDWSGTLSSYSAPQFIALGFSTTSADFWKTSRDFFSTTSASYFLALNQGAAFSTTSADAWKLARNFFATTSSDFWLTQKTTDSLAQGATNKYWSQSLFDTALLATSSLANLSVGTSSVALSLSGFNSASYLTLTNWYSTTTDALAEGATNRYFTNVRVASVFAATTTDALAQGNVNKYYSTNLFAGSLAGTTTSALAEGTNLYFTNARADQRVAIGIAATSTTALAEGINLYFTNARADARINATSTISTLTSAPTLSTVSTALTGFLKAASGVLSTALVNLASDITGILPVSNGGTGWTSLASGAIPYGNGSGALATTTAGANGQVLALFGGIPTWVASTTFSTGLAYSAGNVTNTGVTSNIAGTGVSVSGATGAVTINFAAPTTASLSIPFASTTAITATTASTTNLFVSSAGGTPGCATFSTTGLLSNTGTACGAVGSSFSYLFTVGANYNTVTSATTSALFAQGGLFASSTIAFGNAGQSLFFFNSTTGNLGLGTTSPFALLQLATTTGKNLVLTDSGAAANQKHWLFSSQGGNFYLGTTTDLFATSTLAALTILNNGNVGIGSTSPIYKLDVNGDINVGPNNCYRVSGVCIGYIVKLSAIRTATTTTAWSKPANLSYAVVELWGAGGGSGSSGVTSGGGGGYMMKNFSATTLAATSTVQVVVGAGGTYGGTGTGGTGGTTNFGGMASSTGGAGGPTGAGASCANDLGGVGGNGRGGDINLIGGTGFGCAGGNAPRGGYGGNILIGTQAYGGGSGNGGSGAGGAGGYTIYEYATSSPTAAGNDYAEMFPVSSPAIEAADIVSVDVGQPVSMKLATKGNPSTGSEQAPLAGVIATAPGQVLGDINAVGQRPVALAGRVPAKFSNENGEVKIGDRIAISSTPGVGMKAGPFDDSVGIVIDHVQDGKVMIFLDLHQGIDINSIAIGLLGGDTTLFEGTPSTTATSSALTLDFVGGMMNAISRRIAAITSLSLASSTAPSTATATPRTIPTDTFAIELLHNLTAFLTTWLASAQNGITDLFAGTVHATTLCAGTVCVNQQQLADLLSQLGSANTPVSATPNPATSTSPTLALNGLNPATWTLNTSWQDNLGALFTYSGTSTGAVTSTIYSTSTIDTTQPGSTTIDYWAQVPTSGRWLHATREVVIPAAANDNPQPLSPTGTTTSTTTTP